MEAEFPIEKAKTKEIQTLDNKVKISELMSYPVRGLVFEGEASLDDLCDVVSLSTVSLQEENTPFNVLISESGKRIFLLLQVLVYSSSHNATFLTVLFFHYLFNFQMVSCSTHAKPFWLQLNFKLELRNLIILR